MQTDRQTDWPADHSITTTIISTTAISTTAVTTTKPNVAAAAAAVPRAAAAGPGAVACLVLALALAFLLGRGRVVGGAVVVGRFRRAGGGLVGIVGVVNVGGFAWDTAHFFPFLRWREVCVCGMCGVLFGPSSFGLEGKEKDGVGGLETEEWNRYVVVCCVLLVGGVIFEG